MIDVSVLPLFLTAIFFVVIAPGPDLVLITAYSSTRGFHFGLMISLGIFIAGVIQTLLVAFGLGQLMQAMPGAALGVKIVGACYLGWLGYKRLLCWYRNEQLSLDQPDDTSLSKYDLVSKGLLSNLLNPKALLSFSLFLPQFTTGTGGLTTQILILGFLLSSFALLINCGFSLFFSQVGQALGKRLKSIQNLGRHLDGLLGVIFVGLATRLALSR
ncbi:amino acid transporter [Kiloniella spongiae]|uniref:Amino acid transporter n=1 Tax=Kiloniella spongiae TaxID=1489064 RepID=A0A0H2MGN2_9PROT|nr:LysE family translocator [Kiloniella spongiae]KLN61749.1 amino acid transporter [Kiloniella spongiae]